MSFTLYLQIIGLIVLTAGLTVIEAWSEKRWHLIRAEADLRDGVGRVIRDALGDDE